MAKAQKWILTFFLILLVLIPCYMALNYAVDPLFYFTVRKGGTWYSSNEYGRAVKCQYVMKNRDSIDAVVLGGSKSGVLDVNKLKEYTGRNYYNFYMESGNFSDYLTYADYLVRKCGVKEILLHISSFEVMNYSLDYRTADTWRIPAIVNGTVVDKALEFLKFLMTDSSTLLEAMKEKESKEATADRLADGMKRWVKAREKFAEDPEKSVQRFFFKEYPENLKALFSGKNWVDFPYYEENLNALKQIRQICDDNGVTLRVLIGASSISERSRYEQDPYDRYYGYLRGIVSICGEAWDFSSFNDINMNPYNFYNYSHYTSEVADLQLDVMFGKEAPGQYGGFGILLNGDNIDDYLYQRKSDFLRLKQEYETTGTVAVKGLDDPSNISVKIS